MSQLDEQQFNQILDRVAASAPKGLSEEDFNKLLDAEVAKASPAQPVAKPKNPEPPGIIAEGLGTLKKIGNAIGSFTAPGRYYDDAGNLMPKEYDAQGKPSQPVGSREMGDYVGAHPIREGINVALPIAAETIVPTAWRGTGELLKSHGPTIRKAANGGILGVIGKYAENIGEFMSPTAEKAATAAAAKPVKGARLAPASDEEIAATIQEELNKRLGGVTPVASHTPQTLDEVTSARLADQAASPARAGASSDFTKPNVNAGGTLTPRTGALQADLSRNLDSLMRAPHAPVGNEAALATDAHLADAVASPARAGASTEFMRPTVEPNPNAGGALKPKSVPGIVQEIDNALSRLRQGEAVGAPAPAALASHPAGGRVTSPPNPNSYTATRSPATAERLGKPLFEEGPAAPVEPAPKADAPPNSADDILNPTAQAIIQQMYEESVAKLGGQPYTATTGTVHVPPGAEIKPGELKPYPMPEPLPDQRAPGNSRPADRFSMPQSETERMFEEQMNHLHGEEAPLPGNGTFKEEPKPVPAVVEPRGSQSKAARGEGGLSPNDRAVYAREMQAGKTDAEAMATVLEERAVRHAQIHGKAQTNARIKRSPKGPPGGTGI